MAVGLLGTGKSFLKAKNSNKEVPSFLKSKKVSGYIIYIYVDGYVKAVD